MTGNSTIARVTGAEKAAAFKDLLEERYGGRDAPHVIGDAVLRTLLSHRSVRAYSDKPLPELALETMIAAAQSASTSSNLQTWSAVAVADATRKAALSALAGNQRAIVEAPLQLVWLADLARLRAVCAKREIASDGLDYFELFLIGCIDAALAAQNAAVAAEAMGLGVVYIGGMRDNPLEVARLLALPSGVFAVFGMCVGYPDEARPASIKPRLPQDAVLFRETYSPQQAANRIDDYDALMETFYASQHMKRPVWSEHSGRRVSGASHLSGRDRLKSIVRKMGFPLK
jgi:nitroreductase